jgi:hypothetical protein
MPYVASTLAAPTEYTGWKSNGNDMPQREHSVTIAGGAGVANKHFITPHGVVTNVSDADAEFLRGNTVFQLHEKNGYVQILERKPEDADAVAADMAGNDPGAPLTEADYEDTPQPAPTTGTGKKK